MGKRIAWIAFVVFTIVPNAVYFLGNLYWWLFIDSNPDSNKMLAAGTAALFCFCIAGGWAALGRVWK